MFTKEDLLKISDWTYGCMFNIYCPILKSNIDFETFLFSEDDVTPKVMKTLNEFLEIAESEYFNLEKIIIDLYDSIQLYDYPSQLETIFSNCEDISKSNFLNQFVKRDWVQIELLWQGVDSFKNNYVKVGLYSPYDGFGKFVVYENGNFKTSYVAEEGDELPEGIFS